MPVNIVAKKTRAQKQMDAYKKRTADSLAKTEKGRELVKMGISSGFGSDLANYTKNKNKNKSKSKPKAMSKYYSKGGTVFTGR
tara:strand:+ start:2903 stop:3151 length:249 start_codon:yes stop_codon:yes gene_type:complete